MKIILGTINVLGLILEILFFMLLGAMLFGKLSIEWWQLFMPIFIAIPLGLLWLYLREEKQ